MGVMGQSPPTADNADCPGRAHSLPRCSGFTRKRLLWLTLQGSSGTPCSAFTLVPWQICPQQRCPPGMMSFQRGLPLPQVSKPLGETHMICTGRGRLANTLQTRH